AGVMHSKPYKLLMDQHVKLQADVGTPLPNPENPCHEVLLANNSVVHLTAYCLIGQVVICQEGLQPDIAFFLVTLQFHVNQRSKVWSQDPLRWQSIGSWI
ncbi:hypothetical protein Tco_1581007, partial [Tanacetum coccineum]